MIGILGIVFLLYGIIGGFLVGSFSNELVILHLGLGILAGGWWAVTQGITSIGSATRIIKGRRTRFGTTVAVYGAVFLAIIISLNWLIDRNNRRWDLTEQGVYSLSPQTAQLIGGLNQKLELVAFKGASDDDAKVEDLLRLYRDQNPGRVSVEIVDPKSKPGLVEHYGMKSGNLVYIGYGEGQSKAVSRVNDGTEEAVTNAILKLTRGAAKKIYFIQGHDEPGIENTKPEGLNQLALSLKDEHLTVEGLLLAQKGAVPTDAAAVVLASPKKSLLPEEKRSLIDYANGGGRLFLLADPRTTPDVREIADAFGIVIREDVVLDQVQRLFAGPAIGAQPIVMDYDTSSPITKGLSRENVSIFNIASSLQKKESTQDGATYTELAKSSASAWGEADLSALFDSSEPTAQKGPNDQSGPVTLAMSYEKKLSDEKEPAEAAPQKEKFNKVARVVVFGDSDWVLNANLRVYSNRDLFLNAVNWLAGEDGGVSIRAGTIRASYAPISGPTFMAILLASFLLPEIILIFGLWVWWKRRSLAMA